jgi:hypothetical protein
MSIFVNIGMWFERFVIIVTSLARDYLPSSWSYYYPSWNEIGIYAGTFGLFFTLYLIFVRIAPVVAIAEIKSILKSGDQYRGKNLTQYASFRRYAYRNTLIDRIEVITMAIKNKEVLFGLFDDETQLLSAVADARKTHMDIDDVYTPFPVHGLDPILGLEESRLHIVGFFGLLGTMTAFFGITWIFTKDYLRYLVESLIFHFRLLFQLCLS